MKSVILDFADDGAAFESAKRLVDDHDIELWRRDRMIAKFRRTTIQTNVAPSASSLNVGCPVEACMTFNGRYAQNEHRSGWRLRQDRAGPRITKDVTQSGKSVF